MNSRQLEAYAMTIQMCVACGTMRPEDGAYEVYRAASYAAAIDEVSK